MALLDPISSALRVLTAGQATGDAASTVSTPSDAAARVRTAFAPLLRDSFSSSMTTVLRDAANGAFDDATLTSEAESLSRRLQQYQAAQGVGALGGPTGANAGPAPEDAASAATREAYLADQRQLLQVYQNQATYRRERVAQSLATRFTDGASLPSTATGELDPRTYKPQTEQQARALGQRLAMDLTIGAADLEVIGTQLDIARFDAQHGGGAVAQARVGALQQQYDSKQAYVLELASIVDSTTASGDGLAAVPGNASSSIDAGELARVVARAVSSGASDADAQTIKDLQVVVGDEAVSGNSSYVNAMATNYSNTILEQMREDFRKSMEEDRREWDRRMDQQAEARAAERRAENRAYDERSAMVRSYERKAALALR